MSVTESTAFGEKYVLLERIGAGGMAAVYKSKLLGNEGFEKLVVIKKLLQEHAANRELIKVFISEARLAALLQHDNIAATYDFGQTEGDYFLALEYLQGKDLFEVLLRAKEHKGLFTLQHALMIASRICEGMDYAHKLKDLQGNPLNIVHRDLTPHNIFITYQGKVKIIDFGIARAELVDNMTREGVVKGKISYMSPEQLAGGDVDSRSDIFSIGILLYEMISQQRMYTGDTAELIRKCITVDYNHLEESAPGLSPALYTIVHKALARNIEKRYQSCAELQADIDDLIYSLYQRLDTKILKETVRTLFRHEYDQEKSCRGTSTILEGRSLSRENRTFITDEKGAPLCSEFEKTAVFQDLELTGQEKTEFFGSVQSMQGGGVRYRKLFILLAIIFPIVVMAFFFPQLLKKKSPPDPLPQVVDGAVILSPPRTSVAGTMAVTPSTVEELLRRADKALQDGRLMGSDNDSAFSYYSDVLRADPGNAVAGEGLLQIGDRYADQAEKALADRNYFQAAERVDLGFVASPDHPRLESLKKRIKTARMEQIALLDKKAKKSLARNRLTTPTTDSAFLYYSEIKKIDSGSRLAKDGLMAIADRYMSLAEKAYRQFNYEKSRVFVAKGLKVVPEHRELKQMKEELAKSKPEVFFKTLGKNIGSFFSE